MPDSSDKLVLHVAVSNLPDVALGIPANPLAVLLLNDTAPLAPIGVTEWQAGVSHNPRSRAARASRSSPSMVNAFV